mmetsp:Transcript_769/g.1371  ORF Transcript_769/g.1371 Transcript_769/m.1371 type:complete len:196 (+) Transcript_769:1666-2253(+)
MTMQPNGTTKLDCTAHHQPLHSQCCEAQKPKDRIMRKQQKLKTSTSLCEESIILGPRGGMEGLFKWKWCFSGFCSESSSKETDETGTAPPFSSFVTDSIVTPVEVESSFVHQPRHLSDDESFRVVSNQKPSVVYIIDKSCSDLRQSLPAQPHKWHQEYLSPVSTKVGVRCDQTMRDVERFYLILLHSDSRQHCPQ